MYFLTLLQTTITNIPDVWTRLADNGMTFVLLGIAVIILWRRDSAMNEKMDKYLSEDRKQMTDVISNNTRAFEMLKETLDELKDQRR